LEFSGEIGRGAKDGWSEATAKHIIPPFYITNNLPLVPSLLASPVILTHFTIRFPYRRVAVEMVPVVIGLKPSIDAYRVAMGKKQEAGTTWENVAEMNIVKCIELFAEGIPGVLIQTLAIATSVENVSTEAWISLAVSSISAGFIGAVLSYDYDTDPEKRLRTPEFYGYVPAKATARSVLFTSMIFFSAGTMLTR